MSAILRFLSAHPKLVSAAFICGVISLVIQVLDGRLSDKRKEGFGKWINEIAPQMSIWNLDAMLTWALAHRVMYFCLYSSLLIMLGVKVAAVTNSDYVVGVVPAIALSGIWAIAFDKVFFRKSGPRFRSVISALGGIILGLFGTVLFFYVIGSFGRYVRGYPAWPWSDWESFKSAIMFGLTISVSGCLLYLGPFLLLVLFRPPIAVVSKAIWWLATYPKGAWAGLVWVFTLALGILRLFM